LEEDGKDLPVGGPIRVEADLDGLGVTRMGRVGRVLVLAAGVADPRRNHPVAVAKQLLHSPEALPGEDRGLINHNCHVVLLRGRLFVDGTKPARRVGTSHQSEALSSLPGLRP